MPVSRGSVSFGITPCGDHEFELVVAGMRNGILIRVASTVIGSATEAEAARKKVGYRKGSPLVLAVPRHQLIVKQLSLPTSDPAQIERMVPHEARALAPWPEEEGACGHSVVPADDTERSTVLLYLARLDTVQPYLDQLHEWGFQPTRIEMSSLSLCRLLEEDDGATLLYADAQGSEYVTCANGGLAFSRGARASVDPVEFFRESRGLESKRKAMNGSRCPVYIADATGRDTILGQDVRLDNAQPVANLSPSILNGVQLTSKSPMVGIGAAIGGVVGAESENLLPHAEKHRLARKRLIRRVGVLALTIALFGLLAFLLFRYYYVTETRYAQQLRLELQTLRAQGGDLAARAEQIAFLQSEYVAASAPLEIVMELYHATPMNVGLNYFRYTDSGTVVIGGDAPSFETVHGYLEALEASEIIENIELVYSSKPPASDAQVVEFRLTLDLVER